jgi:surfeit locus 1 family protein
VNARLRFALVTVAAVLAIALTLALGRWQLARAAQKEALQAAIESQGAKAQLDGASLQAAADPSALVHQPARLTGLWVREATVFLDNRQMGAHVGFFVMTPLSLESGAAVVVQRGWVPRNFVDRTSLPAVETPAGVVVVEGRIAPPPSKLYEPGTPGTGAIRQNLDLAQFQAQTGLPLMAMTLQQTGAASEGLLREWPAVNLGVDKHYGYAWQWFGLSALVACLYLWYGIVRRFFHRPKDTASHV